MKKIKDILRCYLILTKRLFYKKSFVAILLFIPILVGAMGIVAGNGDSGVVTIALAMENREDRIASEIVEDLMSDGGLMRFVLCDTPEAANLSVSTGEADAAWIFADGLEKKIEKFVNHTHQNNAFVTVVQREESIFLRLSHEKLNSTLYPYIAFALFADVSTEEVPELTDDQLEEIYNAVNAEGADLFEFVYASEGGKDTTKEEGDLNLIVSPLRGLLAIMVALGGIAVSMFYKQDEMRGVFDRFSHNKRFFFSTVYHATAVFIIGAVVFIAVLLTQNSENLWYELLVMLVYCISNIAFSMCLRLILRDMRLFASVSPVLVIVMVVLCPILFSAPNLPAIQYLLPPFYYLNAVYGAAHLVYMLIYSAVLYGFAYLLHVLRERQKI